MKNRSLKKIKQLHELGYISENSSNTAISEIEKRIRQVFKKVSDIHKEIEKLRKQVLKRKKDNDDFLMNLLKSRL